jgi:hypothetical protein
MIKQLASDFAGFFLGCLLTYILHQQVELPVVIASAAVGFVGSLLPWHKLRSTIYAGSFAGMCSAYYLTNYWEIGLLGLIGMLLFYLTEKHVVGFGGKLGTIAFISVGVLTLLRSVM